MDRLIATNSVDADAADTAPAGGTPQYATSGNPATATPATTLPAYQYNAIQEELIAIIAAASIAPDRTNNAQVLAAIQALITAAAPTAAAVIGITGLTGSAAGGGKTSSWSASEIVVKSALGGAGAIGSGLTLNFNGANTGAGGMDVGASFPAAGELAVYAIYNPTSNTWNTLGTTACDGPIYSGAHMPADYTKSALLWVGMTAATAIAAFSQTGRKVSFAPAAAGTYASPPTSYTAINLATLVPPVANRVSGSVGTTGPNYGQVTALARDANGIGAQYLGINTSSDTVNMDGFYIAEAFADLPMTGQQIFQKNAAGSNGTKIVIVDYSF